MANVHPDILKADIPSVCIDDESLAEKAAGYLFGTGYRNLACVGISGSDGFERLAGYLERQASREGGTCATFRLPLVPGFYDGGQRPPTPEFDEWVARLKKPVAFVTTGGYTAYQLSQAAHRLQLNIPGEVAIFSRSDDEICLFADPPITSVRSLGTRIGLEAVRIIDATLQGKEHPRGRINLPCPAIIERRSTGFPAGITPAVRDALLLIRAHACEGITVQDIAARLRYISRTRLYQEFRKCLGRSPASELMRTKIERARQQLIYTHLPVARVSEDCGFASHAQFSVAFRREVGMTPLRYRKRQQ
jgi:LacI family transcriptional regulator